MLAVKYLVKLYEVPAENGHISAFDTHANTIFTGTDKGILLKFSVEGAVAPDKTPFMTKSSTSNSNNNSNNNNSNNNNNNNSRIPEQKNHDNKNISPSSSSTLSSSPQASSEKIYTTLVRQTLLSQTHKSIERVQHSRTHNLLFVLYEHRLVVLNSVNLSHIQTIAEHVGTFFVSDSQQNSPQRSGLHIICASELHSGGLSVFEFDASQGKHARAILAQELILPEPVQVLVTYGNIACIGMRREYSLLSLSDGNSCGVLSLGGGRQPLLAAGDGEVFMRYDHSIFSVSMRSMPAGRVLGRTIQLEDEARFFVVRHPFLFAFTEHYCDVCSLYDDDVSERLPLPGCLFSSQMGRGDFLYAASKTKIWMACLHSLRHQLANLVERFKVEEAFHLLGSQRAKTAVDLQEIELELHIMAGFAFLHHCRAKEAMLHFNDHIDPRDLLLLIPECIPPSSDAYSPELRALLANKKIKREGEESPVVVSSVKLTDLEHEVKENKNEIDNDNNNNNNNNSNNDFWSQWEGCCPYNTYAGEIQQAWLETFETFPLVPNHNNNNNNNCNKRVINDKNNNDQKKQYICRQVTDLGAVTATTFIENSWKLFKDELILYFRSRLSQASDVYARAMEYALLVLALESQDHRAAYRVVTCSSSLRIEDCYDLLSSLREYRLLACILYRNGYIEELNNVLNSRIYVSSLFPSLREYKYSEEKITPVYKYLPKSMHYILDKLLLRSFDSPCTTTTTQLPPNSVETGNFKKININNILPPSLSEIMYLVSNINLPALHELLRESPDVIKIIDEEGSSPLHILFSLFVLFEEKDTDVTSENGMALLNLILSCAFLLLDYGVNISILNKEGFSCLDLVATAAEGVFIDIVFSALLADSNVKNIVATVEKGDGVVSSRGI